MSSTSMLDQQRLQRALRALDSPPGTPAWNHAELEPLLGPGPRIPAAVLVPLLVREGQLHVLFTRRTAHLTHHAGQVSFPGGSMEDGDADAIAAALRETEEEVGIASQWIRPIGYLDCCETISGYCVTPVVGVLDPGYQVVPDVLEVAEVFEVPLMFLLARENLRLCSIDYRGQPRQIYEFNYGPHRIWGATAAILVDFMQRMEQAQ